MRNGISTRIQQLGVDRVPFVHAVVVRAQIPASVHAGDDAIVLPDGSIEGFVGGQCTESSVRTAALGALQDRRSVLLRVLPEGAAAFPDSPGAQVVVNPCLSGGALEIFLEPLLPPPVLWVVGDSPIAKALAEFAKPLDFTIRRTDDRPGPREASAAIIASHGGDEIGWIRAALDAGVGFVGLVASRRRAEATLAQEAFTESERRLIRSPVGMDIGARTAPEIAVSILAEIIDAIRKHGLEPAGHSGGEGPAVPEITQATDPVCGMTVTVSPGTPHAAVNGEDVWFCGSGCRQHYLAERGQ